MSETGALVTAIRDAIERSPGGSIPFRDYMAMCLYHEPGGYYNRETVKVGKEGDFYTSASVGTVMGDVLADFFARSYERFASKGDEPMTIVEWGGGTGRMAGHLLDRLADRSPSLYARTRYRLVEISPFHRKLQQAELSRHPNVRHADADNWMPDAGDGPVFVFSNELLDAFPVHRVERKNGKLYEWHVAWDETRGAAGFAKRLVPLEPGSPAAAYLAGESVELREGQIVEANPEAADWIRTIGTKLGSGMLVTIDYGDVSEELYGAHRMHGTLLCYRKHRVHDDPFACPGEQDMTSHVNFSSCIRAGIEAGFTEWSLRTQQQFLIDEGALGLLVEHDGSDPFSPAARRNRAVRQLLIGDRMGELFKVLVQTKKR